MPIVDSIDQTETKENSTDTIGIKIFYEKLLYIFKIIYITIIFFVIIFLLIWMISPEKGLTVQSFESTEKNLSGGFVADLLRLKLEDIKEINGKSVPIQSVHKHNQRSFPIIDISQIHFYANSIDSKIAELGTIAAGGTSLSLGQLLLSIKEFIGTKKIHVITGCIQRSGSKLHIAAVFDDLPIGGIVTGDMSDIFPNNGYDAENIIDDLAFEIAIKLINQDGGSGNNPQTWEAFKSLTTSKKAYARYNATRNISDLDNSKNWAFKANDSEPDLSETFILFYNLGYTYLQLNDYKNAAQLFKNATNLNSSDVDSWNGLGITLYYLNDSDNAIEAYNNAIEAYNNAIEAYNNSNNLNPKNADIWYNKALALQHLGKYSESILAYNQVTKINPEIEDAWYNKGTILSNMCCYDEAIQNFDRAIELDPKDAEAWNNKGIALYKLRRCTEAIQAYENAIQLNPGFADAQKNKAIAIKKCNDSIQVNGQISSLNPKTEDSCCSDAAVAHPLRKTTSM
ncbi:MAG: tetratricopeptide repeat protein [Methanothrix sp.]|nr:tetratricopeptide repeat protein [Methanothrix sp.]